MTTLTRTISAALCAAAMATAGRAVAAEPAYTPPKVGTVYEYADTAVKRGMTRQIIDRVEAANRDVLLIRQYIQGVERVGHRRSVRNLITIDSGYQSHRSGRAKIVLRGLDTAAVRALWPFKPGATLDLKATVNFARAVSTKELKDKMRPVARVAMKITVERRESITVPAGTFDTVVIRRQDTVTSIKGGAKPGNRFYRIWYEPKRGIPVKVEFAVDTPENLLSRRELKEIRGEKG